jgi:hypothetical protein
MSAKPNPSNVDPSSTQVPEGAPVIEVADPGSQTHASPARALQTRLARELAGSNTSWVWHSIGLVLVAVLSMWAAGFLLSAQI